MLKKTPSQDLNSEWSEQALLDSYREAAMADDHLFGDFDGYKSYGINRDS